MGKFISLVLDDYLLGLVNQLQETKREPIRSRILREGVLLMAKKYLPKNATSVAYKEKDKIKE